MSLSLSTLTFVIKSVSIAARWYGPSSTSVSAYKFGFAISVPRSCAILMTAFPDVFLFDMSANALGTLSSPS